MKRILWVCNVPIPKIAKDLNVSVPNICGWLVGFANSLEVDKNIELHICFPILGIKRMVQGKVDNINYYAFSQPKKFGFLPVEDQLNTSKSMENQIEKIIKIANPDILHIFGTEYPHSLVATKKFNRPNRTVVNIQGLTSFYSQHYNSGVPIRYLKKFALSNIARGSLLGQAKRLEKRGVFEIETINSVGHVIGRTDWDEACTKQINPSIRYHFCNESLRDAFYDGVWELDFCETNSIFMSQAATPIKGLHFMLKALTEILREFPNTHLYIAGNNLTDTSTLYSKLKISSYALFIKSIIKSNKLEKNVTFTGSLTEEQMKARFLKSNVFVCPSTIENSPNSLGEAMLLGVPCVSSDVGGVKNMLEHNKEGFIYQSDASYMLAFYVKKIFGNPTLAHVMGKEAKKHARSTHNRENNLDTLLKIYGVIIDE